jgi:hypothetical protein
MRLSSERTLRTKEQDRTEIRRRDIPPQGKFKLRHLPQSIKSLVQYTVRCLAHVMLWPIANQVGAKLKVRHVT